MDGAHIAMSGAGGRRTALFEKAHRYGLHVVTPVKDLQALLPTEAVPCDLRGKRVRVNLKLLSYCIPLVAGIGVMVGGMKTAGTPLLGLPQLIAGIALTAAACWYFVSDSGRLDLDRPRPQLGSLAFDGGVPRVTDGPVRRSPRKYSEDFRRHAVTMVRSTGWPIARVARELDVSPGTLGGWVKKDRMERAERAPTATLD